MRDSRLAGIRRERLARYVRHRRVGSDPSMRRALERSASCRSVGDRERHKADCRPEGALMSYCKICGDESKPQGPFRFWSPDDGWVCGRLCPTCKQDHAKRKPRKEDFAYDK